MQLPGLITIQPEHKETIDGLARMMGRSFMEERWTSTWLGALDALGIGDDRKREISCAIMKYDFIVGAPYECCYMLPDMAAGTGAYLSRDLRGQIWDELEGTATKMMVESTLTGEERTALLERAEEMGNISNFRWMVERADGADFIHFFSIGVNADKRGSGAFRRLMTPFFSYADEHGITCYLECYSDRLEGLYGHFGFKTVRRFSDPAFDIVERAMARSPRQGGVD